jgi:hypothetical protein
MLNHVKTIACALIVGAGVSSFALAQSSSSGSMSSGHNTDAMSSGSSSNGSMTSGADAHKDQDKMSSTHSMSNGSMSNGSMSHGSMSNGQSSQLVRRSVLQAGQAASCRLPTGTPNRTALSLCCTTWRLVAEQDRMIVQDNQRFMAERMRARARSHAVDHAPIVTTLAVVLDVLREALSAVQTGKAA